MSPQADPVTGRRRLVARGNASSTTSWRLRDLPRGTYYWSVQAIDPAFAGSPFGLESSFVISNARPTVSIVATQTISNTLLSPPISFVVGDLETAASALVVAATSCNTNRIPNEQTYVGGTSSNRTVQLRPLPNQLGSVTITLTVIDDVGWTRDSSLEVTVINHPPSLAGVSNLTITGTAREVSPGRFEFIDTLAPSTTRFYRVSSP